MLVCKCVFVRMFGCVLVLFVFVGVIVCVCPCAALSVLRSCWFGLCVCLCVGLVCVFVCVSCAHVFD